MPLTGLRTRTGLLEAEASRKWAENELWCQILHGKGLWDQLVQSTDFTDVETEVQGGFTARSTSCNKLKAETEFTCLSLDSLGSALIPWSCGRGRTLRKRLDVISRTILKLAPSSKITPFSLPLLAPHHFSSQISEIVLLRKPATGLLYLWVPVGGLYFSWSQLLAEPRPLGRGQAEIMSTLWTAGCLSPSQWDERQWGFPGVLPPPASPPRSVRVALAQALHQEINNYYWLCT